MTVPALAAWRFLIAAGLGALLGLYYGFLRPLRPRLTTLSDLLFVPALFWVWLYLNFGVCLGDIRMGYNAGLLLGGVLFDVTLGRLLRPVFRKFWQLIGYPVQKFFKKAAKIANFLLLTAKKAGTMVKDKNTGGTRHGSKPQSPAPDSSCV